MRGTQFCLKSSDRGKGCKNTLLLHSTTSGLWRADRAPKINNNIPKGVRPVRRKHYRILTCSAHINTCLCVTASKCECAALCFLLIHDSRVSVNIIKVLAQRVGRKHCSSCFCFVLVGRAKNLSKEAEPVNWKLLNIPLGSPSLLKAEARG